MDIRLYDWPASPFCMKVRAILDYKGVAYERINILGPAWLQVWLQAWLQVWLQVWRRGRIGKVPALEIDGELVCDSTDIAYRLDELFPESERIRWL